MPSPDFTIDAGPTNTKASVSAATAVVATLVDTTGVSQVQWVISRTDDTTLPSDYTGSIIISGSIGQTFQITSLAAGTAAVIKCTINGGLGAATDQPSTETIQENKFYVLTAGGNEVLAAGELDSSGLTPDRVSSATHGAAEPVNAVIRSIIGDDTDVIIPDATTTAYRIRESASAFPWFQIDTSLDTVFIGRNTISSLIKIYVANNTAAFQIQQIGTNDDWFSISATGAGLISLGDANLTPRIDLSIVTNQTEAFLVHDGNNDYFTAKTLTSDRAVILGNALQDPTVRIASNRLAFGESVTLPVIAQDDELGAGISGETLTIIAQAAFGSGVKTAGLLDLRGGPEVNGTGTGGGVNIQPGPGTSTDGAVNIRDAGGTARFTVPDGGNVIIDGLGSVQLRRGGADRLLLDSVGVTMTTPLLRWEANEVLPVISQADETGAGISGDLFTIRAQASEGTGVKSGGGLSLFGGDANNGTDTGGSVIIAPGAGTTNGSLTLQDGGGTARFTVASNGNLVVHAASTLTMQTSFSNRMTVSTTAITALLPLFLAANGAHNVETLAAAKTLSTSEPHFQKLDANGSSRNVDLPAEATSDGLWFWIRNNTGGAFNLVVRDDSPATIETLADGDQAIFICDGTTWESMGIF